MTPDHEAAKNWAEQIPKQATVSMDDENLSHAYLDAMARLDKAEKVCDHTPAYNSEHDNYYCTKCHCGMGNAYYKLSKELLDECAKAVRLIEKHEDGPDCTEAQLDKATELLRAALDRSECYDEDHECGETDTTRAIRAFLERKTDDKQS